MKLPNSAKDFEKIMKNVDFTRVLQITVPILQPVIIGGLWLMISRFDKRADALSKLIAIAENSTFYKVNNIAELDEKYNGITEIIELWFSNYKGPNKMISNGFGEKNNALDILKIAINEYQLNKNKVIKK